MKKLPTLPEGEALAVWLELNDDQQKDYAAMKKGMEEAQMPMNFVSLDEPVREVCEKRASIDCVHIII